MLEINFHHLKAFHAVVRHLSYSRAAEDLYISQPAVSRLVQDLEKSVGAKVFHRQGKRISLTDAGHKVHEYTRRVLDLTDELEQVILEMEDITRGRLRLAASSTPGNYLLPAFLGLFSRRYPQVEVSILVSNSQQAAVSMQQRACHLGFVSMQMEIPGIQWQSLATDELVIIAPYRHPLAGRTISAEDLLQETLIVREPGSGTRHCFDMEIGRTGKKPQRILEIGGTEAIKRAVAAGLGVSAIPRRALTPEETARHLAVVEVEGLDLRRPLGLLAPKGTRVPPAALVFAAALQKGGV